MEAIRQIASICTEEDKTEQENNNTKTQDNMKQKIKLTEGDLHRIIKKAVRGALNEGMTSDNSYYEKWEMIKDILGSDKMVDDIFNYLDSSMLEKIVDWFDNDYDLFENDEEDDW